MTQLTQWPNTKLPAVNEPEHPLAYWERFCLANGYEDVLSDGFFGLTHARTDEAVRLYEQDFFGEQATGVLFSPGEMPSFFDESTP